MKKKRPQLYNARLIIPATFNDCLTYAQQILFLYNRIAELEDTEDLDLEEISTRLDNLESRATSSETGISDIEDEIKVINTELLEISNSLSNKQDTLTAGSNITIEDNVISATGGGSVTVVDDAVTEYSTNPVKSSGIYSAIENSESQINSRIDGIGLEVDNLRTDFGLEVDNLRTDFGLEVDDLRTDVSNLQVSKQDTLTAGSNITIEDNVISATGGGSGTIVDDTVTEDSANPVKSSGIYEALDGKQNKLTAGTNITITDDVISASGGSVTVVADTVTEYSANPVKSSGIYTAIEDSESQINSRIDGIDLEVDNLRTDVSDLESDVDNLQVSKQAEIVPSKYGGVTLEDNEIYITTENSINLDSDRPVNSYAVHLALNDIESQINTVGGELIRKQDAIINTPNSNTQIIDKGDGPYIEVLTTSTVEAGNYSPVTSAGVNYALIGKQDKLTDFDKFSFYNERFTFTSGVATKAISGFATGPLLQAQCLNTGGSDIVMITSVSATKSAFTLNAYDLTNSTPFSGDVGVGVMLCGKKIQ